MTHYCDGTYPALSRWRELAGRPLSVIDSLSEFIDNSIDAGAKTIDIDWRPKHHLTIRDDGRACQNPDDVMGESKKRGDASQIGQYGTGMKHAAIYLAGAQKGGLDSTLSVESGGKDFGWRMSFKWASQDTYKFPWHDLDDASLGFEVRIAGKEVRNPRSWEELHQSLAIRYWDALRSGMTIRINNKDVPMPIVPAYNEEMPSVDVEVTFEDGRSMRVEGGVLQNPKDQTFGVLILYRKRALVQRSNIGCGDYACRGIFVVVRLLGPWNVHTNKTGIDEAHEQELADELYKELLPLLQNAQKTAQQIEDTAWINSLKAELNPSAAVSVGTEDRGQDGDGPGGERDGDNPTRTGPPRRYVKHIREDDTGRATGKPRRSRAHWKALTEPGDGDCMIRVDRSGKTIWFQEECDIAMDLWRRRDSQVLAICRAAIAFYTMPNRVQEFDDDKMLGFRLHELYSVASQPMPVTTSPAAPPPS